MNHQVEEPVDALAHCILGNRPYRVRSRLLLPFPCIEESAEIANGESNDSGGQSNRALERQTTYMNVSWQSTLVASQTKMLEYPAKAKSAIVKAMLCLCYMNFASHFFINHSPDL
ncbi:conserved hypothetical protein [Vibrio chagasii]|nr:conserved hypothetical protein [Vibrio chagasii]CAH7128938.1 conserved hypothetical protein [Vibrio chagasii]CAH7263317.1 conserved hypothetical protein [Vibrio chagasii]CAH7320386.1 conserved hypothetical protein [Vibrio chagasii]